MRSPSPIAADLLSYYDASPFNDRDLFLARKRFVNEHRLDEATIFANVGVLQAMPAWFAGSTFDITEMRGVEPETAIVCEVRDHDGETTIDLAAWRLERPTEIATLTGRPRVLGAGMIAVLSDIDRPIKVYRSVGHWLGAWALGVVLTDVRAVGALLEAEAPFEAEDDAHGVELQVALRKFTEGRIVVAEAA